MTTVTQHDTHEPTGDTEIGAGRLLRDARLAKDLDITEAAASLRLEVRAVNNLEADAYDKLPGPTFVRGYLRSYARLLDIPAGPILEAYERHQFTPPPLVADIADRAGTRSGDFPVRLVTYAIVIVLASLVVLWWQNQRTLDAVPTEDVAAERQISEPLPPETSVMEVDLSTEDESREPPAAVETPTRIPVETEPTEEPSIVDDETMDAREQSLLAGMAPVARASTLDVAPLTQTPRQNPAEEGNDGSAGSVPTATGDGMRGSRSSAFSQSPPTQILDPAKRLRMEFKHESWVEVYGANDERLYYDLARAGDIVELDGSAPIRVLLGYAKDVVIEYEGAPFDYSGFLTRNMARFTLGVNDTRTTTETSLERSSSVADNHSQSDAGTSAPAEKFSRQ